LEVTSTVTIPTPEQPEEGRSDTPSVWEGTVAMPDVTKFAVRAYQVTGIRDKYDLVTNPTAKYTPFSTGFGHFGLPA
jgi:hypothetical protein